MARRSFACGHSGKGQYCHRCAQEAAEAAARQAGAAARQASAEAEAAQRQRERQAWEASFAADPIDLRDLQTRERVQKARELLRRLADGEPYTSLGGKRWESDRNIISVPVGRGHRLVLRDEGGRLRPLACMTHEAYNGLRPGKLG
ncbi:MAG: hypothetical protein IPO88_30490 [Nannocystis sp.]|uniref:DUF7682 family zinc-binding protein n=1 Tax=Nannocystis sp. TaxID=1962667 RepID=UPI002420A23E|nr:hypothetical protein [Nannocystis sp.]MBK9757762.1 hypothetical protein [Nannocystis sp.]